MSDRTRIRINAAFDDELSGAPVPASLRALSIRNAVTAPKRRSVQPQLLVVIATIVVVALVASVVIGSHLLRSASPVPALPAASLVPPAPRLGASLVYDRANHVLVLFGGAERTGLDVNETWTWDGKSWRLYHPRTAPPVGTESTMAYDQSHGDVVLYSAVQDGTNPRQAPTWTYSTWMWDGSSWTQLHPRHQPTLSFSWTPGMAFDPISKAVLLFGFGQVANGGTSTMQAQTWSWNGSDWNQFSPSRNPDESSGQLIAGPARLYIPGSVPALVQGGYVSGMWEWDGFNWNFTQSANRPTGSMAFDQAHGTIVSFGPDTWTWDGSNWVRVHPRTQPPVTGYMVYFPPLREAVMWGDVTGFSSNDMWAWNGSDWQLLQAGNVAASPTPGHLYSASPADAAALIRKTVTSTSPVLLPTWLPDGLDATVDATPDFFSVTYQTDQRDKQITFGIMVANPPPGGPNQQTTWVKFRNSLPQKYGSSGYALYFVYDTSNPQSQRWLMWTEPGSMSPGAGAEGFGGPGVSYFLSASGYTDQEFWQVANSLQ